MEKLVPIAFVVYQIAGLLYMCGTFRSHNPAEEAALSKHGTWWLLVGGVQQFVGN
jgi:hypothetical protein